MVLTSRRFLSTCRLAIQRRYLTVPSADSYAIRCDWVDDKLIINFAIKSLEKVEIIYYRTGRTFADKTIPKEFVLRSFYRFFRNQSYLGVMKTINGWFHSFLLTLTSDHKNDVCCSITSLFTFSFKQIESLFFSLLVVHCRVLVFRRSFVAGHANASSLSLVPIKA